MDVIITRVVIEDGLVVFKAKNNNIDHEYDFYHFAIDRLANDDDYSFWHRHLSEKYWYTKMIEADFFNLYMSLGES